MEKSNLNERQAEAVAHKDGPLLIVAGAGAGKTKTITSRIAELIHGGVAPRSILAVTFTNKAAKEMRDRVNTILSQDKNLNLPISFEERPLIATFHGLGVQILKENAREVGIVRHFNIFDKSDSRRAVKEAVTTAGLDPKQFDPGRIQNIISREKGNLKNCEKYAENAGNEYLPQIVVKIWREYEKILADEKALDFDDLLLKTVELLQKHPKILESYQQRWLYIHIDEYQDTNRVQYMLAKLLASAHKNICVVGDIDQTIYTWRGATIRNLMEFEKDYPDAKIILLEENYRSTKRILEVANTVIKKNKQRIEKNLFTGNPQGEKFGIYPAYDEMDEAAFIASKAKSLIAAGVAPREIAVLYRANFQSRAIEEAFLAENLPYQVLGVRFFERKEVKDVLSYIKAALNPDSASDLKRIINTPPQGIGKTTFLKLISGQEASLPAGMRQKINNFRIRLARIKECALKEKPSATIKFVLSESGLSSLYKTGDEEDTERLENLKELASLAIRYDNLPPEEGIEKMLADAALASDQDDLKEDKNAVRLMTVHSAKGLEFETVFITGLEENLFPHKRIGEKEPTEDEEEEERRLFYVALTRAKKKIFLTYASVRTIFGSRQMNIPSEFFADIDNAHLDEEFSPKSVGKIVYLD